MRHAPTTLSLIAALLLAGCTQTQATPTATEPVSTPGGTPIGTSSPGPSASPSAGSPSPSAAPSPMPPMVLASPSPSMTAPVATVELKNADGDIVGRATLTEAGTEGLRLDLTTTGIPAGRHGLHFHAVGKCDAPGFESAGAHFNPTDRQHGLENPQGPHSGDLPNLEVGPDGHGTLVALTNRVSAESGPTSLFDSDGTALVVHADQDDQMTDPSGDSGSRIACGVVQRG